MSGGAETAGARRRGPGDSRGSDRVGGIGPAYGFVRPRSGRIPIEPMGPLLRLAGRPATAGMRPARATGGRHEMPIMRHWRKEAVA